MRVSESLVGLLVVAALAAAGCHRGVGDVHDPWGPMKGRLAYNLPPAERLMEPGPGVGGPGPGIIPPVDPAMGGVMTDGSVIQASYGGFGPGPLMGGCPPGMPGGYPIGTSQVAFLGDDGIMINWDVSCVGSFDSSTLFVPGRQDFMQGAIYRLRISNIPGREGAELFPTLEIAPVTPRTDAYLAHAPIPVQFTDEDFDQVLGGNFVTKVIYLPDPEFQELALANVETLVSTRLEPGVDPIAEADRRGSILAILRMGNKDLRTGGQAFFPGQYGPMGPDGVICASYDEAGMPYAAENCPCGPNGACADGSCSVGGPVGGAYSGGQMPLGMPTAGFAPAPVPPQMLAGGPTWGHPITGTPIGLPGPPHIPLGSPAGLQRHVIKNRTRVVMPPPVTQMSMSVKQRPGMNYPRPVNHVAVDEVHREPGGLFPGLRNIFGGAHANAGMEWQGGAPVNGHKWH